VDNILVMAGGEQVDLGMRCNDPESVIFPLEAVYGCSLVQIPDSDSLVLARRENQVLVRVKETATGVLEVSPAGVNLPLHQTLASIHILILEAAPMENLRPWSRSSAKASQDDRRLPRRSEALWGGRQPS